MPLFLNCSLLILFVALVSGCSTYEPVWRAKAMGSLQYLDREGAPRIRPDAYGSIKKSFLHGEEILKQEEDGELADLQYQLAFQKSEILKLDIAAYKACMAEKAVEEAAEAEELRLEEESRKAALAAAEEEKLKKETAAKLKAKGNGVENGSTSNRDRLHHLPTTYTVRRGETLPQIAARPEVYNDSSLWQIIYRANRDQVRDPYQLWPGQVLKIPRNYSKDDAADAKKTVNRR